MCSALVGVDIGSATLVVVAVLACLLAWTREDSQHLKKAAQKMSEEKELGNHDRAA